VVSLVRASEFDLARQVNFINEGRSIAVTTRRARKGTMLWTLIAVFLILWLLGFSLSIGGILIHLLLVVALVVFVINLMKGRRAA
jgi:magnesium-transporting ATPase (P-type)